MILHEEEKHNDTCSFDHDYDDIMNAFFDRYGFQDKPDVSQEAPERSGDVQEVVLSELCAIVGASLAAVPVLNSVLPAVLIPVVAATLPMYYIKNLEAGPRVLTVEPCRYYISGCSRGDSCRFSHLCSENDESIRDAFQRSTLELSGARPAFFNARQAPREGLSAPEIYERFPDGFPAPDGVGADLSNLPDPCGDD